MPPKGLREGRALGAGETARLITPFSNDRIICYGSFDSSLILSLSLSHSLSPSHFSETKACVASRVNNGASSSNVASGNSEISECGMRTGEGGRCLGNRVDGSLQLIKNGCPWGICHSDLPLSP